jgi:ABC-2 type transport system permease protein
MQVPFADFIAPGLIVMGMMNNAFANASFSLLVGKIQGTIVDYLMPPLSTAELLAALVGGAVTRAVLVGVTVWAAMALAGRPCDAARLLRGAVVRPAGLGVPGAAGRADVDLGGEVRPCRRRHQFRGRAAVAAVGHLLFGRWPGPGVPCDQPCQPFFYVISGFRYGFLGLADRQTLGGAIVLGIDAMAVLRAVAQRLET